MRVLPFLALAGLLAAGALPAASAIGPTTIYSTDFESGNSGWSSASTQGVSAPAATTTLGIFGNDHVTLDVDSQVALPAHDTVTIKFRFYTLESWDGHNGCCGPDFFNVHVDGVQVRQWTFAIAQSTQSYPDEYPANNPAGSGAVEVSNFFPGGWNDAYYDIVVADIPHADSNLLVGFEGANLQGWSDEGWTIDNVEIVVNALEDPADPPVPEATTLALVGVGVLAVLAVVARRR